MASLSLLPLVIALFHAAQSLPAVRGRGRGLDVSVDGASRQRRDLRNLLPYEGQMMSYPVKQGGDGADSLYYQSDDWRGHGLDLALQRLVERDERRELEEEQQKAYLATLLRLLSEAERAGLVSPADVEVVEEDEEDEEDRPPRDFQGAAPLDYDETGQGLNMGRSPAAWWGHLEPQLAKAMLERMEPQLAQALLEKAQQERRQHGRRVSQGPNEGEEEAVRHLVTRLLSSFGPNNAPVISSSRRVRRDLPVPPVGSAHKRTRRSLDDITPPSPSNEPPLFRVKRLEGDDDEEQNLLPPTAGLQRMKRIDTMVTTAREELNHGGHRRRRRSALMYDPQILIDQIVEYMKE